MTLRRLASLIARHEGKKHQASIGDIREILKIIVNINMKSMDCQEMFGDVEVLLCVESGKAYAKKKRECV